MSGDPFDPSSWDDEPPAAPPPAPSQASALGPLTYLDSLNPEQRLAVEATEGPVLVLAGAGTGKTRVLTTRIAHILAQGKAWPGQILAVTFTNKAAREMRERVEGLIGGAAEGMSWLGTFHSISARILRRHAELVGLRSNFTILDTDDQLRLLKQVIAAAGLDEKRNPPRVLAALIDRWKNRALTPDKLDAAAAQEFADGRGQALYAAYQARLAVLNAADFGDLLLHTITLFTKHREVIESWQRRFKYSLVDEYQDTNVAQYLWLRLLAAQGRNICCVGDDDQSVYGWRGAEVGNILRFETDFPGAQVIRLEHNYRSTLHILGAASGLIAANHGRLGKTLWTDQEGGEKVSVRGFWDGDEEARETASMIEDQRALGHRLSDMAILVRAGHLTRAFEERFVAVGLPYRVIGGLRFYERLEIRDALAYLRVVVQPDDDLAFERIVNTPKRGLGDTTIQALHGIARSQTISLYRAARLAIDTDELKAKARNTLRGLIGHFDRWRDQARDLSHTELAEIVLDESGYTAMWQADKTAEAPGRLDNLKELVDAMAGFESLPSFLDHVALVMEMESGDRGQDMVSVMTLHGAKGLEFPVVFLPGWEEGLFPSQRSMDESGLAGLEEERRLAYVGITRARDKAVITHAANRRIYNQWQSALPSRFIDELPPDHIETDTRPGLWAGQSERGQSERGQSQRGLGTMIGESDSFGPRGTSPGWRRASEQRRADPLGRAPSFDNRVIDGAVEYVTSSTEASGGFGIGDRVFHQKFGYGRITALEGNKLDIDFDQAGAKKVIASFVTRAVTTPVTSPSGLKEARIWLTSESVGIFELMLTDIAVATTTMTPDDGRSWSIDILIAAEEDEDGDALMARLTALVGAAAGIAGIAAPVIEWRVLPETDWVAETQKILHPLHIGRFWVHGPDHHQPPPVSSLSIEIEAGLAFGTGRHGTTAGCLLALEHLAKSRQFRRVVDLGCGSGILAMGARHLWPATVWASDVDPVAVAIARANAGKNAMPWGLRFATSDGLLDRRLKSAAPYDLIIANILARPLVRLAPQIAGAITRNGRIVLSGLMVNQESLVLHAYLAQGLKLVSRIRRNTWATLILAA